ncbi:MAG: DUF1127 domain-containing protein [Rhodospirillales bacterium]|nr:DUF1127 domain-containing protein [Rhodospirillales bacterium]
MYNAKNDDYRYVNATLDQARAEIELQRVEEVIREFDLLVDFVKQQIFGRIATWYKRQRLVQDLEALDDRLLADIGITRAQIPAAVKKSLPYAVTARKVAEAAKTEAQPVLPLVAEMPANAVNDRRPEQAAA